MFDAYLPAPRHDAATAAARLAAELGVPLGAEGPASTGLGYPPWRFGMAENPYLFGHLRGNPSSIWAHTGEAKGPFEFPPARERIPGEMGNREQREARYTDPLFQTLLTNLAVREKGLSEDFGGPTNQGISQRFLNQLHEIESKRDYWAHLPKNTKDLTRRQIESILQREFYFLPKVYKVAMIPGLLSASPNFVEQLFDTGVLHGAGTAARIAQLALNEHSGKSIKVDGDVGKETRKAIAAAIRNGRIDAVNNTMVEYRLEAMRELPDFRAPLKILLFRASSI